VLYCSVEKIRENELFEEAEGILYGASPIEGKTYFYVFFYERKL